MFLARIINRKMYKAKKDYDGYHWYLVYTRKGKVLYLRRLTHLYKPDHRRFRQVKQGIFEKRKVTTFDTPQGVTVKKIKKGYKGELITMDFIKENSCSIRKNIKTKKL